LDFFITIIIIIFTALTNAVVSGILIYYLQKRTESLFAEELEEFKSTLQMSLEKFKSNLQMSLEEFKANLQKSSFEHQTKFSLVHAKRVETLQTLYKKTVLFSEDFLYLTRQVGRFSDFVGNKIDTNESDYERLAEKLLDFKVFFIENRLFLPDEIIKKIESIYEAMALLYQIAAELIPYKSFYDHFEYIKFALSTHDRFSDQYSYEEWEDLGSYDLLKMINKDMNEQVRDMESLYKSIADTNALN
jgi:hypothetical protein